MTAHKNHFTNFRLIFCAVLFMGGALVSSDYGDVHRGNFQHKLIALVGVLTFVIFAIAFLHILTSALHRFITSHRLGTGRAAALQFMIQMFGYLIIFITALDHMGVPVERIILGSAVLGIILGVAAQQALANFFASIVLIVSHPFMVGEQISIFSGALGGKHEGRVIDIGLTHTHLKEEDGTIVLLPNSTLLIASAIKVGNQEQPPESKS